MASGSQMAINKVSVQEGSKEESPLFVFAHYIWWKRSDDALADERRLIAQVMNIGTWEDVRRMEKIVSQKYLAGIPKMRSLVGSLRGNGTSGITG